MTDGVVFMDGHFRARFLDVRGSLSHSDSLANASKAGSSPGVSGACSASCMASSNREKAKRVSCADRSW